MNTKQFWLVVAAFAAGLQISSAGTLTGVITLEGTPPPEQVNEFLSADPNCGKLQSSPVKTQFYVVGANKGLKDVVITIQGVKGKFSGADAPPLVIDQKGCIYFPYVAAAQVNQKVMVKNSDPVMHTVRVTPLADGNTPVNAGQTAGGPDVKLSFGSPESFVRIQCAIHSWMIAYVTVVDNPYFSVSDQDGKFKISNLPPGKYTLQAAHRKAGKVTKEIEIKDGDNTADLTMHVPG